MSTRSVSTVVVDDHQMAVLGIRTLFHRRPEVHVVAWAHDAEEGLIACLRHRPRVAVLDVGLDGSGVDGVELCRHLRAVVPEVNIVVYTGLSEIGLAKRAFAAGACAVVSKADESADLLKAILLAAGGRSYASPEFLARAGTRELPALAPRQLTALRLLAHGLEQKEIAERMGVSHETVKTHLAMARRRLRARTSTEAVAIGLSNALFEYTGPL